MMQAMRSTFTAFAYASLVSLASAQPGPPPANPPAVITAPLGAPAPAGAPPPPSAQPGASAQPGPSVPALPRLPTPGETLGSIGRFIDRSINNVGTGIRGAGDAVGGASNTAGEIAKNVGDAAGTVARLPLTRAVSGWEACPLAANGAPDCEAASVALCKAQGFKTGKSVDITAAQKCPAVVWIEKREPKDGECKDEAFVSKAICQ
jgi:hypothetical protein